MDDRCAALDLDARLVAKNTLRTISSEAYSRGGQKNQNAYYALVKNIDTALIPLMTGTCSELAQKEPLKNLVKYWNTEGMVQIAVWDKLPAEACRITGPEHARLRSAAKAAYQKLSGTPEDQWRALFDSRVAFHTKRCVNLNAKFEGSATNDSIHWLKLDYENIQNLGPQVKAAQENLYGMWGVRGDGLGYVGVKHSPKSDAPHSLKLRKDKSLLIEFDQDGITAMTAVMKINSEKFKITQETPRRFVMASDEVERFLKNSGQYAKIALAPRRGDKTVFLGEISADNLRKVHEYGSAPAFK